MYRLEPVLDGSMDRFMLPVIVLLYMPLRRTAIECVSLLDKAQA